MSTVSAQLDVLQRWMLDALIAPDIVDRAGVADRVLPGARLDAAACLGIYRRSYILRLRRCLAEQFPATRHALGENLFDDFADDYLRDCPSNSHSLYDLGRRYPGWLEQNRPDRDSPEAEREDWIDFLVDLAHYEYELFRLFDTPGHEDRPWPDAGADDADLVLQPALVLATYRYPVAAYYHDVRAARSPEFPARQPSPVVILRRDYHTTTYPVSELHYRFLTALRDTGSIDTALDTIAAWTGRDPASVRTSWREAVRGGWLEAGFFVGRGHVDTLRPRK